jgi:hypothetical protein
VGLSAIAPNIVKNDQNASDFGKKDAKIYIA